MTAIASLPGMLVRTFVIDYGWDWDDWHDWTVDALAQLVLPDVSRSGRR